MDFTSWRGVEEESDDDEQNLDDFGEDEADAQPVRPLRTDTPTGPVRSNVENLEKPKSLMGFMSSSQVTKGQKIRAVIFLVAFPVWISSEIWQAWHPKPLVNTRQVLEDAREAQRFIRELDERAQTTKVSQDATVAAINILGGIVTFDEKNPGKPINRISLSNTKVTDSGLENLKGLTSLQELYLSETKVTDAGLVHLKGLTSLQELSFKDTEVTDAGLVHLKGLSLRRLYLEGTLVTTAGVKDLQSALPKCRISK